MLTREELLQKLADKYDDWLNMACSFKISKSDAEELVQEMFVRIFDYVKDPQKIMYSETEVNTFYIYITLRNLYYANIHTSGRKNPIVFSSDEITDDNFQGAYEDSLENIEAKEELEKTYERIEAIVNDWYWYDRGIFNLYYKKGMSMREIASETKISLSSIFNTLKNAKEVIRKKQEIESTGLGDSVEKVLRKTGIAKVAKAVLGEDCGCANRQELLNNLFPYKKYNAPTDEELDVIEWLFEKGRSTISGSMVKEIYSVYNRIFNDKLQPTSCSSCFKPVKQKLLKIHNEFNKK